jgi:RND family efflux transporter MFP subunit
VTVSLWFLFWAACSGGATEATDLPAVLTQTDLAVVTRGPVTPGPRVSGTLEALHQSVLRTEVAGSVSALHVDVGAVVRRAQPLVDIDNDGVLGAARSASAAVAAAERDFENAARDADRVARLVGQGGLSQRDADLAQSARAGAEARLLAARAQAAAAGEGVSGARVMAPIDGVVATLAVDVGDVVAPGLPLITLVDPSSLRLEGAVAAAEADQIHVGDAVVLTVQGREASLVGTVAARAPAVDPVTRQVAVLVDVPNPDGALLVGSYARGRVAGTLREALLVPVGAVTEAAGAASVGVVRDGRAARQVVTLGARDVLGERVEVVEGLAEGDTVLVGAARGLRDGAAVELRTGR